MSLAASLPVTLKMSKTSQSLKKKKQNLELSKVEQFSTGLHCKSGKENYFPLCFLEDICQLEPQQRLSLKAFNCAPKGYCRR